jgi:hypothetical protein
MVVAAVVNMARGAGLVATASQGKEIVDELKGMSSTLEKYTRATNNLISNTLKQTYEGVGETFMLFDRMMKTIIPGTTAQSNDRGAVYTDMQGNEQTVGGVYYEQVWDKENERRLTEVRDSKTNSIIDILTEEEAQALGLVDLNGQLLAKYETMNSAQDKINKGKDTYLGDLVVGNEYLKTNALLLMTQNETQKAINDALMERLMTMSGRDFSPGSDYTTYYNSNGDPMSGNPETNPELFNNPWNLSTPKQSSSCVVPEVSTND